MLLCVGKPCQKCIMYFAVPNFAKMNCKNCMIKLEIMVWLVEAKVQFIHPSFDVFVYMVQFSNKMMTLGKHFSLVFF